MPIQCEDCGRFTKESDVAAHWQVLGGIGYEIEREAGRCCRCQAQKDKPKEPERDANLCAVCDGKGYIIEAHETFNCSRCDGTGCRETAEME